MTFSGIEITQDQQRLIVALLNKHVPHTEVWVYGSRIHGTSRATSDLDMAIFSTPAQVCNIYALKDDFDESNLPFRVDVFPWNSIPESFQKNIQTNHVVLVNSGK